MTKNTIKFQIQRRWTRAGINAQSDIVTNFTLSTKTRPSVLKRLFNEATKNAQFKGVYGCFIMNDTTYRSPLVAVAASLEARK